MKLTMQEWLQACYKGFFVAIEALSDEGVDELWSEDTMKNIAIEAIEHNDFVLAYHICEGINNEGMSSDAYYKWDRSAGTTCAIKGLNCAKDVYYAFVDYCSDYMPEKVLEFIDDPDMRKAEPLLDVMSAIVEEVREECTDSNPNNPYVVFRIPGENSAYRYNLSYRSAIHDDLVYIELTPLEKRIKRT